MEDWKPIETAPPMKNLLLFAVTDTDEAGKVRNWKMDTGYYSSGAKAWTWSGYQLKSYDIKPTHWMHVPKPPSPEAES